MGRLKKSEGGLTLDEFVETIYLPRMKMRKKSWDKDAAIIRQHISPRFGGLRLRRITSNDIEDWQADLLAQGFSPGSCNRYLAVFKTLYAVAETLQILPLGASPCRIVRNLRDGESKERFLTREEGTKLMSELAASTDIRARALQLIMLTGARKNEILKASWDCVDFENQRLKVPISKSGATRHITLSKAALNILASLERNGKWLFPSRRPEKPLTDIFTFWDSIRKKLGLGDVRIHDLRHTFASYLVNEGHTLYEVQTLLGHSDPRTTMRYAHLECKALLEATDDVSEILFNPESGLKSNNTSKKAADTQKNTRRSGNINLT